jgi:hypothetical protein
LKNVAFKETQLQNDRRYQRDLAKLGLNEAQVKIAQQREARMRVGSAKKGGFTQAQKQKLQAQAADLATTYYKGAAPKQRYNAQTREYEPVPGTGTPPVLYWAALKQLINHGVPYSMARKTLDRLYKPGEGGRPRYKQTPLSEGARNAPR